jgi:hypothetical protein
MQNDTATFGKLIESFEAETAKHEAALAALKEKSQAELGAQRPRLTSIKAFLRKTRAQASGG